MSAEAIVRRGTTYADGAVRFTHDNRISGVNARIMAEEDAFWCLWGRMPQDTARRRQNTAEYRTEAPEYRPEAPEYHRIPTEYIQNTYRIPTEHIQNTFLPLSPAQEMMFSSAIRIGEVQNFQKILGSLFQYC